MSKVYTKYDRSDVARKGTSPPSAKVSVTTVPLPRRGWILLSGREENTGVDNELKLIAPALTKITTMIPKHTSALLVLLTTFLSLSANAQSGTDWLENTMFSSGKINVVVAVIAIIFILLVIYLVSIDRKLKKLERSDIAALKADKSMEK